MFCWLVISGINPEHSMHLFSRAALLDMVPSKWNCGLEFVTQLLPILVFPCMVEIRVSWSAIGVLTKVGTCISVDTCIYKQLGSLNLISAEALEYVHNWYMSVQVIKEYDM